MASMNAIIMAKPMHWMAFRPMTSTKATANQYPGTVPQSAMMACARAMRWVSSSALMVHALGTHFASLKIFSWRMFWE
jgi:hypothetical protein